MTKMWMHWGAWSLVTLVVFLCMVGFGWLSSIILCAWTVGVVVAAVVLLFVKPKVKVSRQPLRRQDIPVMRYGRH